MPQDAMPPLGRKTIDETFTRRLIAASKAGDEEAFTELISSRIDLIKSECSKRLRDDDEVEEAVNIARLKAWRSIETLRGESIGQFNRWLQTLSARSALQVAEKREKRSPEANSLGRDESNVIDLTVASPSPEADLVESWEVEAALRQIPPTYAEAVVLYYWHGMNIEEIARYQGAPIGTTKSRLSRAKVLLLPLLRSPER